MVNTKVTNQNNFIDNQNYDINIDKIFTDFITEIDSSRSFASVNIRGTIDVMSIATLANVEKTMQESRCHAFFRLIGFPVVSKDFKIYNPGFDIINDPDRKIKIKNKSSIANNPIEGFNALSYQRETYTQNNLATFSNPQSIEAGVLALSSGGTKSLRKFVAPLEKSDDSFDMNIDNQSYTIDTTGLVGKNDTLLNFYEDAGGNPPTNLSETRFHIIKPFIVDARIELSTQPQSKSVAVPFIPDQSYAKVSATEFVKRPLLEKIIRDRFFVGDQTASAGTATNDTLNIIAESLNIKDEDLIKLVSNKDIYGQSEQSQLIKFINIIRAMMQELVKAQHIIRKIQGDYYWLPAPATIGPEGGSEVQGVFLPNIIGNTLVTKKDAAIILAKAEDIMNGQNAEAGNATAEPDLGNFALKSYVTTFGPDTSSALGNNISKNLESLSQKRFRALQQANNALRTVEVIMGEFSGFGLCDIIAIMGALNIMPKDQLLGFLDEDSIDRMNNSMGLDVSPGNYTSSMNTFVSVVKDFYNLMDKIYQDLNENNGNS